MNLRRRDRGRISFHETRLFRSAYHQAVRERQLGVTTLHFHVVRSAVSVSLLLNLSLRGGDSRRRVVTRALGNVAFCLVRARVVDSRICDPRALSWALLKGGA